MKQLRSCHCFPLLPFLIYGTCFTGVFLRGNAQKEPAITVVESSRQHEQRLSYNINGSPPGGGVRGPFVMILRNGPASFTATAKGSGILVNGTLNGLINPFPERQFSIVAPFGYGAVSRGAIVAALDQGQQVSSITVTAIDDNNNAITAPGSLTVGYGLNAPINVTVQPTSGTVTPTGKVSLLDGGVQIAQLPLDGAGNARFVDCDPFSAPYCLSKGLHGITVAYSGDANFSPVSSPALAYTVGTASPFFAVLFAFRLDNTLEIEADFDTGVTSMGTAPTGSITFLDTVGATTTALEPPVPLSQSQPIIFRNFNLGPGTHTIALQYSGDSTYLAASASSIPFVAPALPGAPPQITFTPPVGPLMVGQTATFTINVTSSQSTVPTGNVDLVAGASFVDHQVLTLANGSVTFQGVVPNTYSFQPSYLGDSTFASGWGAPMTLAISKATVPLSIISNSQNVPAGPVTLTGTFVPLPEADLPQERIQFFDSFNGGQPVPLGLTQQILSNSPAASISAVLPSGVHTITAVYSGDVNYNPVSSNALTIAVNGGTPSAFSLATSSGGDTATVAVGQTAHYNVSLNGNGFIGVVSLSCSGAPAGMTCTSNPATTNLTDTITTVNLLVTAAPHQPSTAQLRKLVLAVPVIFGLTLFSFRRKAIRSRVLACCMLGSLLIVGMAACAGSSATRVPTPTPTPTPAPTPQTGTFTLTLTATSGSTSSSIPLKLTVTP
jgi:hypothetical protein